MTFEVPPNFCAIKVVDDSGRKRMCWRLRSTYATGQRCTLGVCACGGLRVYLGWCQGVHHGSVASSHVLIIVILSLCFLIRISYCCSRTHMRSHICILTAWPRTWNPEKTNKQTYVRLFFLQPATRVFLDMHQHAMRFLPYLLQCWSFP